MSLFDQWSIERDLGGGMDDDLTVFHNPYERIASIIPNHLGCYITLAFVAVYPNSGTTWEIILHAGSFALNLPTAIRIMSKMAFRTVFACGPLNLDMPETLRIHHALACLAFKSYARAAWYVELASFARGFTGFCLVRIDLVPAVIVPADRIDGLADAAVWGGVALLAIIVHSGPVSAPAGSPLNRTVEPAIAVGFFDLGVRFFWKVAPFVLIGLHPLAALVGDIIGCGPAYRVFSPRPGRA